MKTPSFSLAIQESKEPHWKRAETMKTVGRGLLGLAFTVCMFQCVNGNDSLNAFTSDVISTFGLISPTIVYDSDEAPKICMTRKWVLCLSQDDEQNSLQYCHLI